MHEPYRAHRERFLAVLTEHRAAALVPTATVKTRNHDSDYRFRPDSDFWYLTGFGEPEAWLVLRPRPPGGDGPRSILFLRERDPERETWTGRRLGVERAAAALGVDEARPIARLWEDLPGLLRGHERLVYRAGIEPDRDRSVLDVLARLRLAAKSSVAPPAALLDTAPWLHELRLFKGEAELERMRRAAGITREAHVLAMRAARPGVNEREIDALLEYTFRRRGGNGAAYTNIVAGGANATILHYNENDQPLRAGELLLVDAGCEVDHYASDVTRTFPVDGRFTPDQRALYEVVLEAQRRAIEAVRPGARFDDVHAAAVEALCEGLARLALCAGSAEEVCRGEAYKRFYMHRTSHWLGLDVHDCGAYVREGASRVLEPGMVLTVEPGLYVAADDATVAERWRGIGIRIEDDVLVTAQGREVLSAGIPKEVEELETLRDQRELAPVRGG